MVGLRVLGCVCYRLCVMWYTWILYDCYGPVWQQIARRSVR